MKICARSAILCIASCLLAGEAVAAQPPEPVPGPVESPAARSPADCDSMYPSGTTPAAIGSVRDVRLFCHQIYASGYSPTRRNPLWVAQRLTRADVERGELVTRGAGSTFRAEPDLLSEQQAADGDFDHNVWDKGHMAPANDAPDLVSQRDTFFLSNAVPQHERLNRYMWAYLEGSAHQLAAVHGEVFIVTGPIFGRRPEMMNGRVPVPAFTFKAIYIPALQLALGFVASNRDQPECRIVSISQITRRSGINPFPRLSARVRAARPDFMLPRGQIVQEDGRRTNQPLPDCRH